MYFGAQQAVNVVRQAGAAGGAGGLLPAGSESIVMLVAMGALMYFLMIRPQKKKQQEEAKLKESMKIGDTVVTIGGIRGKVTNMTEDSFEIETGSDKLRIEFLRQALSYIVTPVPGLESMAEDTYVSSDELGGEDEEIILEEEELDYDEDEEADRH